MIKYDRVETMMEYQKYLDGDGDINLKLKSGERNGWTNIPYGIPYGVVVTHASINIGQWVIKLIAKINL